MSIHHVVPPDAGRAARSALALLLATTITISGCMSLSSHESSALAPDSNGVVVHHSPSFDNGVTWFGWTMIAATTAAGAYGGMKSDVALRWNGWDRPAETLRDGNIALGALAGFSTSLLLTYLIGGDAPTVTPANAALWVRRLDDDLLLVRADSQMAGASRILTIPADADSRFTIRSLDDARIFASVFPESMHAEQVVTAAADTLPRRDLPALAELFPNVSSRSLALARYVRQSDSLAEAIALADRYPEQRDVAAARAASLVRSIDDARRFVSVFPDARNRDSVALSMARSIARADIPRLAEVFPAPAITSALAAIYTERSATVEEALEAGRRYPEQASLAEARALALVSSVDDAARVLEAYPSTGYRAAIGDRLARSVRHEDIPRFLTLFPGHAQSESLKRQLVEEATSVAAVIESVTLYPELAAAGESRAAKLATSLQDFRQYLAAFPQGSRAAEMSRAVEEDLRTVVNLGPNVNSEYSELLPVISPDGRTLFFDRKYSPDNTGGYADPDEIWFSELNADGEWGPARRVGEPLNDVNSDHVGAVTPDGNTLLLGRTYDDEMGFSMSHRTSNGWSHPTTLDIKNYYNLNSYIGGYYLANDGRTILASVQRRDSRGGRDIYVSFLLDDGVWSEPMNVGATLNTRSDEDSPFLAADGVTLYFSSSGHRGFGESDILMTRRLDATWKRWSKPVNLGPSINTPKGESFFFIPASGEHAYFASAAGEDGSMDIVRIGVPKHARPKPVVLVSGRILDRRTGKPLEARVYYETLSDGKKIGEARSDPRTGSYKITLPAGAIYGFRAEAAGYIAVSENLDLTRQAFYSEQTQDLTLVPMEAGQTIRLSNLFFDVGRSTLRKESIPELDRLADLMKRSDTMAIEITGHTDDVGEDASNMELSRQRADAVRAYIIGKGVAASRVGARGLGESTPVAPNDSDEGRRRNRRVEFTIVRK